MGNAACTKCAINFADAAGGCWLYHSRSMNGTGARVPVRRITAELIVMAALALLFALLGPFGTSAVPLGRRLVDWLLFAVGGYIFFRPIIAAGDALSAQTGLNRLVAIAFACTVAALPTTLFVAWILVGSNWGEVQVETLAGLYPQVFLAGAIVTGIQLVRRRLAAAPVPQSPASAEPAQPTREPGDEASDDTSGDSSSIPASAPAPAASNRLLDQLPASLGRDLLYLENEDHYVRAHTPNGSALILMRMRDAVADLAEIEGARVHRSWWVARRAVAEVIRRDRAILLRLVDGREVPVARSMAPELRSAGWFA